MQMIDMDTIYVYNYYLFKCNIVYRVITNKNATTIYLIVINTNAKVCLYRDTPPSIIATPLLISSRAIAHTHSETPATLSLSHTYRIPLRTHHYTRVHRRHTYART